MDVLAAHAARHPEKPALLEDERVWSWAELIARRNRLGHGLVGLGLPPGGHVIVYAENSLEHYLASTAARAAGLIPAPMNHRLVAEEVVYILDHSDAVGVLVSDRFLPVVEAIRAQAGKVRQWILLGTQRRPWGVHVDDLLAAGRPDPVEPRVGEGFGASVIYTGGTTGKPKGALRRGIDPQDLMDTLRAMDLLDPAHVHLVAGPMYHSAPGGLALYTHLVGGTVVIMPKFDPEQALAQIERHRCTSTFMAPTLLKRIVDLPAAARGRYDVSSMRAIIMAAAPCPMSVKESVVAHFGPTLYEFYGSSELGVNTVLRPEDVLRKPGSCGRAAPGREIALLDDDGRPVPTGEPGELYVRRFPGILDEYYRDPEATEKMRRGDWYTVGDVAYVDADGFYYICDRKRDMIISAGVNIYPAEIEDVLHRHPEVLDAAVFGVPDDEWGERVHAAVHVRPGQHLTAEEITAFCREHMAGYKVPREVSFHDVFPRDAAGKLLKRQLREPYWAGRAARV
ncbi:MAG TPA: AMP-binding protein [Candidatus Limnocylindria bacterium]|nr:AMP-binding protein [Candidatus Limnocylindria bacterium]